ncbi:hypothetical protein HYH02_007574 [Chlamydomonas schloesseri]|uniref:Rieske domain-containing protein n=1 Tax=Chlamydomonas schloesseri TaxID=2026947 RepID=A0A835WHJ2_9CHLO|nr:hypothetical protein HYH02_007574 [Chlamydomonas schloesseri]|eukprot:KAG2447658.1 hypothetical protein HYH02_007574 [Chlamydomonas schloesseri]
MVTLDSNPPPAAPAPTSTANLTEAAAAADSDAAAFPWYDHWYPVGILEELDPSRPHAVHLLGVPLALWRDAGGQWRAVEDSCPHRAAPLSEGRVEQDGSLRCAYHGWQFDGSGACKHIPQLINDDKAQAVACAGRRTCVRAFPTQEAQGLLWVLPDASPAGWAKVGTAPVNAVPELLAPGGSSNGVSQFWGWYSRDMPIRCDTMVENLMDPSHVCFAHHGTTSNRKSEKGTVTALQPDTMTVGGFTCDVKINQLEGTATWQAPCLIKHRYTGMPFYVLFYCVPTRPGWGRFFETAIVDTKVKSKIPAPALAVLKLMSSIRWRDHITRSNAVLDGDSYILHVQERNLLAAGSDWRRLYHMPAPADGSVVATRQWLDTHGRHLPTCAPEDATRMPPCMSKAEVLERYHQHTKNCRACSQALRNVDWGTYLAAAAGLVAAAVFVARLVVGGGGGVAAPITSAPESLAAAVSAVVCAVVFAALRRLREQFIYVDYVHQDKN